VALIPSRPEPLEAIVKTALLLLSLCAPLPALLPSAAPQEAPRTVREAGSRIDFPVRLEGEALAEGLPAAADGEAVRLPDMDLLGVGIRTKTWFDIRVYAMGLYWDAAAGPQQHAAFAGQDAETLGKAGKLQAALLEGRCALTLRLVMCRDVDGDDMAEAFDDSLKPRLETAMKKLELRGKAEDLATFRGYFDVDEVKEDVELLFTWTPDGRLHTRMKGKALGTIDSPALARALFDVYLGEDPISEKGHRSLVARAPELLEAARDR
jgi:hypothetical protein